MDESVPSHVKKRRVSNQGAKPSSNSRTKSFGLDRLGRYRPKQYQPARAVPTSNQKTGHVISTKGTSSHRFDSLGRCRPRQYQETTIKPSKIPRLNQQPQVPRMSKTKRSTSKIPRPKRQPDAEKHPEIPVNDTSYHGFDLNDDDEDWYDVDADADADADIQNDETPEAVDDQEPIYAGHWMPVSLSVTLIWMFVVSHSVTGQQLADLLCLISLHCLNAPIVLKSVYRFRRYFANLKSPIIKHQFCSYCFKTVDTHDTICQNTFCSKDLTTADSKGYFLTIPLISQIQSLFRSPSFVSDIQHRFTRSRRGSDTIEDVYDGSIYRSFMADNGPLSSSHPYNLSFTINTDGAPIFKSSKMSIWPIYLMINELPYVQRRKRSNMLFYGIWFGSSKPVMSTFCEPLFRSLSELEHTGVQVEVEGQSVMSRCFTLFMTADLPARSIFLNMVQFNGSYSCVKCVQPGQNYRTDKGGNIHVFPFQAENTTGPPRNTADSLHHATEASDTSTNSFGIKGHSFLMALSSFDYVRSTSVDYMHCVLQGVTKLLLSLWFLPKYSTEVFSLSKSVAYVDSILLSLKPPSNISRIPRSISEHLSYWKAAELRSWLLFYSLPILKNLQPFPYYYHFACFVEAISLLSQESISPRDLYCAQIYLEYFVSLFDAMYGPQYLTLNIHSLLHLTDTVRDIGPLWSHSCFPFENMNGHLLSMFHGTQHISLQILNSVNLIQTIPSMVSSLQADSPAYVFLTKLCKDLKHQINPIIRDTFLGRGTSTMSLSASHSSVVLSFFGKFPTELTFFKRLRKRGFVYHSTDYSRSSRCSSSVSFLLDSSVKCGQINWFCSFGKATCDCVNVCSGDCKMFACVTLFSPNELSFFSSFSDNDNFLNLEPSHVQNVRSSSSVAIFPLCDLLSLLVTVKVGDSIFICRQPNRFEGDL